MLTFNYQAVSSEKIGREHGLSVSTFLAEYRHAVSESVTTLYANKEKPGAWSRWLTLGYWDHLAKALNDYTQQVSGQFDDLLILGIGGSSLGGYALLKALLHPNWNLLSREQRNGFPRFHFIENVDGDQIQSFLDILTPERTLINVISKSGTTAETMSAFMYFKDWLEKSVGQEKAQTQIVATTDPQKGILRDIANKEGYTTFEVPDDVGGRFSVFSAVGLLPAALCGISIPEIQHGICDLDRILQNSDIEHNPAALNAAIQIAYYKREKPISVLIPYSARLAAVADWYVQLWAESLGKKTNRQGHIVYVGPTPLKAVGVTDQHSQVQLYNEGPFDKIFTFIEVQEPDQQITIPNSFPQYPDLAYLGQRQFQELLLAEMRSTQASLSQNQRPHVTLSVPKLDAYHFAQLLYFLEVQTAIAGSLLGIDPFDQPGVELAKQYTHALMGRPEYAHLIPEASGNLPLGVS